MAAVEAIFEAGSALVLELLSLEHQGAYEGSEHRLELFVRVADALAGLLGLDLPARLDLAERRRSALLALLGPEDPGLSVAFRARGRALVALLEAGPEAADPLAPSLGRYGTRIARLLENVPDATRAQLALVLPDLLHLEAVRLLGPHRAEEQTGTFFWLKALKSVAGRQRTGRRPAS